MFILHASILQYVRAMTANYGAESGKIEAEDLVSAPFSFSVRSCQGADQ